MRPAKGPRPRLEGRPIDGLLLVDKPAGLTSHDVVDDARRALRTKRIGHAGTLDPFATGLLVLLAGHATRLLPHLNGEPKVYQATIAFGSETDTDDVTGSVTRTAELPDVSRVREAIKALTGPIDQVPPAYSAKQVDGRRAYAVARRGEVLTLAPVRVTVHAWEIREIARGRLDTILTCGGGTYIRALARDLGRLCDSAAHLSSLRRTRSGSFDVANAVSVEALRAGTAVPQPARAAVSHLPAITLPPDDVRHVRQGRVIPAAGTDRTAALLDSSGALVAIAEAVGESWQPRVVLPDA
jgi:tRNA pseudouridine55 synthase